MPSKLDGNLLRLALQLQHLRTVLGQPITIHSGYRSPAHNRAVDGVPNSRHLTAQAADFSVSHIAHDDAYCATLRLIFSGAMLQGGLGIYETHLHYDTRGFAARWNNDVPVPMCGSVPEPAPPEEEPMADQALNNRLKVTGWFLIAGGFAVAGSKLPYWLTRNLKALLAAS